MTEEEAKTKWCPHVARDPRDGNSITFGQCCIGSQCMAWRWEATVGNDRVYALIDRRNATGCTLKEAVDWVEAQALAQRRGFCGLAGEP